MNKYFNQNHGHRLFITLNTLYHAGLLVIVRLALMKTSSTSVLKVIHIVTYVEIQFAVENTWISKLLTLLVGAV